MEWTTARKANEFDCELYDLLQRAREYANDATNKEVRQKWIKVMLSLSDAREPVRSMMSKADLKATAASDNTVEA